MYNTQVSAGFYEFSKYVSEPRWSSYYKQIDEILHCNAKSVLLIGAGDKLVPQIVNIVSPLISIETYDFDSTLKPDIYGDIRELSNKVNGRKWDAIVCCQVLEHLPYTEFEGILSQLSHCLKENGKVIISLPDSGGTLEFHIHIPPRLLDINFLHKLPKLWRRDFKFGGEHYWEINSAKIYTIRKIRAAIKREFNIDKEYVVRNNTYHRFFVLSK